MPFSNAKDSPTNPSSFFLQLNYKPILGMAKSTQKTLKGPNLILGTLYSLITVCEYCGRLSGTLGVLFYGWLKEHKSCVKTCKFVE
jgi:hypothetical protein